MKKILASLLALALCAPAMAATVSFVDNTDGTGTFTITTVGVGDEYMVGLGLDVDATAAVTAVAVPAAFNVYPDAGNSIGATFDPWGVPAVAGGPVCAKTVPGEIALPAVAPFEFALCFANLNAPPTPGAPGAQAVAITFSAANGTQITIGENATRGGVVGTLGEDIALTGVLTGTITDGPSTYNLTTAAASSGGATATTGGTVTNPGIGVFAKAANQPANLVAAANANWFFWKWTGSAVASATSASTTIMMDADKSVTANFTYKCSGYNFTNLAGGTDNLANATDLNNMIAWVNLNKGAFWSVPSTNAAYNVAVNGTTWGLIYNLSKKMGSTDNIVNATDVNLFISFVNARKGAFWSVNCSTCGC
jgi:hypothetical protein